ncbi:unnamed protein product [Phytophthora fragariaefolia]|uniref:Unnamed protein product n=1 Tax=Phytophthora fragariaefolia TaxID=1490495 RepID=A0A9W6X9B2_9STRA|nr:unnamed protein product [Phytophthora fragariaefolia]
MQREAAEAESESESESDDDESDSESEGVAHAPLAGGVAVPGLTPNQIKKLLDLAAKADAVSTSSSIEKLQRQISQLMADKKSGGTTRERGAPGASLKEIKALQQKLTELERKTQTVAYAASAPGGMMPVPRSIYTPLLVKDDPEFKKYFKLQGMDMPLEQIKTKMQADGVSPSLLDTPDEVSPNDPGVRDDWSLSSPPQAVTD